MSTTRSLKCKVLLTYCDAWRATTSPLARAHCMLGLVMVVGLIAFTAPAAARQQGTLIDAGAIVVHKQTLLRNASCVQLRMGQLDEQAYVLALTASRQCDCFNEPILRRLDAFLILGALAAAAAGNLVLGRVRRPVSA